MELKGEWMWGCTNDYRGEKQPGPPYRSLHLERELQRQTQNKVKLTKEEGGLRGTAFTVTNPFE